MNNVIPVDFGTPVQPTPPQKYRWENDPLKSRTSWTRSQPIGTAASPLDELFCLELLEAIKRQGPQAIVCRFADRQGRMHYVTGAGAFDDPLWRRKLQTENVYLGYGELLGMKVANEEQTGCLTKACCHVVPYPGINPPAHGRPE